MTAVDGPAVARFSSMSTTASSGRGGPPQGEQNRLDPDEVFAELVWDSPEVCNDCFAHIRDRTEHDTGANRLGTGNRPTETLERCGAGIVGQDCDDDPYHPVYFGRTFCGECGRPGGRARADHLSIQEAVDRVPALVDRIREGGVAVDEAAVYALVREAKSREQLQGYDREIFERAVSLGVRRARG